VIEYYLKEKEKKKAKNEKTKLNMWITLLI